MVYEHSGNPDAITRYLIEAGYSSYDGSGGYHVSRSHYNGTPAGFYLSTRSANGTVFNVRLAVATDRRVEDDMRVFAGVNLLYAKNSFHTGEMVAAGSTVPPVDEFGYMNGNSIGASVSIPLGFEYRLNDVLSLRGGAEEGYSFDNFTSGNDVYGQFGGQSTRFFSGSLWSVISAGSTYRVGSKVEVSLFISYDFLQVAGTAFSIFYSL